ncbi:MAG: hypothetical protein DRJ18_00650 [Candidatus Methanomethylicota archaeon]|nr:MAG: hypothetical protein DRJ18_00650 [Candidatus Verstraetearchaeota archaeon]
MTVYILTVQTDLSRKTAKVVYIVDESPQFAKEVMDDSEARRLIDRLANHIQIDVELDMRYPDGRQVKE